MSVPRSTTDEFGNFSGSRQDVTDRVSECGRDRRLYIIAEPTERYDFGSSGANTAPWRALVNSPTTCVAC